MRSKHAQKQLLKEWARYLVGAAQQGGLARESISLQCQGIAGPRAGALQLYAGVQAPKLLRTLAQNNAALLRQFVPWQFTGEPACYMAGRFIRVEAGWPPELSETLIRLSELGQNPKAGGRWIAGKNEAGLTVIAGLSDKTPHYLVSGQTGSGKTVALRSAVLQLSRDRDNRIILVDGKMGEGLASLQHLPGVVGPVATEGPEARAALGWACLQMRERYQAGSRQGRLIVAVDEFQEWAGDTSFVDLLRKLAAQGRAAGVHLLAATQHPTVEAFGDASTRRNLAGKLALRVADPDASRVAVGGRLPRADYLLGAGDCYAVGPGAVHRVQMAYVGSMEISRAEGGSWLFEEWPPLVGEDIGLDLPESKAPAFSAVELAISLVSAVEGEGRPTLQGRLEDFGLDRMGSDRAARLLALGRDIQEGLGGLDYELHPVQKSPEKSMSGAIN